MRLLALLGAAAVAAIVALMVLVGLAARDLIEDDPMDGVQADIRVGVPDLTPEMYATFLRGIDDWTAGNTARWDDIKARRADNAWRQ